METSIRNLKQRCDENPQDIDAVLDLVRRYSGLGKYRDALKLCRETIEFHSRSYRFLLEFANALYRNGDIREARLVFSRLSSIKPDRIEAWNNWGVLEFLAGNFEEARAAFESALKCDSLNAGALCNLGNCCSRAGDDSAAAGYFERAVAIKNDFVEAWYNLGNSYIALERFGEAKDAFENAVKHDASFGSAYKNKGFACERLEEYDEALECYVKAASLNRNDAGVYANMAGIYARKGQYDKALECGKRAARLAPASTASWGALREAAMGLGDGRQYYQAVTALINSIGDDDLARSIRDLRGMGFEREAAEILEYAVKLNRKGVSVDALPFAESRAPSLKANEINRQLYKVFNRKRRADRVPGGA